MHTNTNKILKSVSHVYIPKSILLNVFLIYIVLEHFGAQAIMNFVSIPKAANPRLKSFALDCSVSDNPTSMLIYRKYPPSLKPARKFNIGNNKVLNITLNLESEECTNVTGQYECSAIFLHRTLEARTINVQPSECRPKLCDKTLNDQFITVTKEIAKVKFCVLTKESIYQISLNGHLLFDKVLINSTKYDLLNKTNESEINFKLSIHEITKNSLQNYTVKVVSISNLTLEYRFTLLIPKESPCLCDETHNNTEIIAVTNNATVEICVNHVVEVSDECFTTMNATMLKVTKNNTVIIKMCVEITDVISSVMINGHRVNGSFSEYTTRNTSKENNTQFIIEFWNLINSTNRDVSFYVTTISGMINEYTWYLPVPEGQKESSTVTNNSVAIVIPIIGLLLFFLIITIIGFLRFKSKSMKRRQRYGQAYDNVTYKSSENMLRPGPLPAYHGSSQTPGRSLGPPKGQEEENLYSPQGTDHYVNDDGLIYVVMGDMEKRKSTSSVKANKQRVQYLEIDFTKTGKIKITEAETDTPTEAQLTTAADVEQVTLTTAGQINETEAGNQNLFVSKV